jgi:small GTP-binding protein
MDSVRHSRCRVSHWIVRNKLTVFPGKCREGEGFLLVYSITARATFERIERFRQQIVRVKDSDTIPIVLVGNKADRANEREVGRDEGQALAKRLGCEFVETSAKTRSNLELAYYTAVRLGTFLHFSHLESLKCLGTKGEVS